MYFHVLIALTLFQNSISEFSVHAGEVPTRGEIEDISRFPAKLESIFRARNCVDSNIVQQRIEFDRFFQKWSKDEENLCEARNSEVFREDALKVMKDAFSQLDRDFSFSKIDYATVQSFRKKMLTSWSDLLDLVRERSDLLNPIKDHGKVKINDQSKEQSMKHVTESLEVGMVPLPSFLTELDKEPKEDHFRFQSLKRYLFLGVAPVSMRPITPNNLSQRDEHALRPHFLVNMYALADHDIQHGYILGNYLGWKLGLGDPDEKKRSSNCRSFQKCVQSVIDRIDARDLEKGRPSRDKVALYYLIHEDPRFFRSGRPFANYGLSLGEFSFEWILGKKGSPFSFETILPHGMKKEDLAAICSHVEMGYILSLGSMGGGGRSKESIERSTPFMDGLISDHSFDPLNSISRDKLESSDFFRSGVLEKLYTTCRQRGGFDPSISPSEVTFFAAQKLLREGFKKWEEKGFRTEYEKDIEAWIASVLRVEKDVYTEKSCFSPMRINRVPLIESAREGDLREVKFLLENQQDPNELDAKGRTALHYAVENGNKDLTGLLLDHNAHLFLDDTGSRNIARLAVERGKLEVLRPIVQRMKRDHQLEAIKALLNVKKARKHGPVRTYLREVLSEAGNKS